MTGVATGALDAPLEPGADGPGGGASDGDRALRLRVEPGGLAVITFDVPGEAVNTLRASFAAELDELVLALERDRRVTCAVLVSGKPDSWVAGADVEMLRAVTTAEEAAALSRLAQAAFLRIEELPKPVVAAVHGACLGGGFELALACRDRVLSDDPRTVLGLPEVQLGLIPGGNGLQRLARLAGLEVALGHGLTGKRLYPRKARALGLAADVVPRSILERVAADLARRLAAGDARAPAGVRRSLDTRTLRALALEGNPLGRALLVRRARADVARRSGGHYPAPGRVLDVLDAFASRGFTASAELESRAFGELAVTPVARRLIELFLATTELKKDSGVDGAPRRPREVAKVFVIGAGLMGSGIAYVSLEAGATVRLRDRDPGALARGRAAVGELYDERVRRRRLRPEERAARMARLTGALDASGLRRADLVIEAVFEDLALKRAVLREVEGVIPDEAVFASNTSSLPLGRIAEAARVPERVVGMHYFSPVQRMPLLEVVRAEQTSEEAVATAVAFGKRQGKTVIVVRDGVGFYTTRILGPYLNEASWLLSEGVPIETIDRALVAWGWPVGAMTLLDEIGLDVAAHVGPVLEEAFGARMAPPAAMRRLADDGRRGRKNGRGLYRYDASGRGRAGERKVDVGVYEALGVEVRPGAVADEEIQLRCALALVNEAMHVLGEGLLRSPRDGDVGAVLGLGFPPFRGGPFRFVDASGAADVLRRVEGYRERFGARFTPAPALVELSRAGGRLHA